MRALNHRSNNRVNLSCPFPTTEDAVVAHTSLQVMCFHVEGQSCAKVMCSQGLANATNIVSVTFNGGEKCFLDGLGLDQRTFVSQLPFGQLMGLKHFVNGLQIKGAREVHDGKVFFVKVTNLVGFFMQAFIPQFEQILERLLMSI